MPSARSRGGVRVPSPDVGGSTHVCFNTATYQVIIQSAESKCSSYLVLSGIYSDDQPPIAYQLRSSPVRRPTAHLTALRAWCTRCLPVVGENPTCSVPALWECEGHTAMVSRLRTATHEMSTPPPPYRFPATATRTYHMCKPQKRIHP